MRGGPKKGAVYPPGSVGVHDSLNFAETGGRRPKLYRSGDSLTGGGGFVGRGEEEKPIDLKEPHIQGGGSRQGGRLPFDKWKNV